MKRMKRLENQIALECDIDNKDAIKIEFTESGLFKFQPYIKGEPSCMTFISQESAKALRDFLNERLG